MAWLFELAVECGPRAAAEAVAAHFAGTWSASVFSDGESSWCRVVPEGVSRSGVTSEAVARELTAAGRALYERLRTAPPFRFALVGVEVEGFATFSELEAADAARPGIVLGEEAWARTGKPALEPFRKGYVWRPYAGEHPAG